VDERNKVIDFDTRSATAIVDTSSDYMALLNPNSYQKGAWVLHMLRNNVGDAVFQKIIRGHYKKFAGKNASSEDFIATAENVSHKNLKPFFKQWLHQPGLPVLAITWEYHAAKKNVVIVIEQKQKELFNFPIELLIQTAHGKMMKTIVVGQRNTLVSILTNDKVTAIVPDPQYKLLWKPYVAGN